MRRLRALAVASLAIATTLTGSTQVTADTRDKITINVWLNDYPIPGYLAARVKAAEDFNRLYPRYHVNVVPYDYTKLPADLSKAAKEGKHPTIANYYSNAVQVALDTVDRRGKPLFKSVEKAIGKRDHVLGQQNVLPDLVPAYRSYYTRRGDLTSMPTTAMTSLLFANTTVLAAAGITEVPRTWAALEAACDAIAKLPDGPPHCATWANHNWFPQQAVLQQDAPLANHGNGRFGRATRVDLDSAALRSYVSWLDGLHDKGHFLYTTNADQTWEGVFQAFGSQQVAFALSSANTAGLFASMGQQGGFQTAAGRMPYNDAVPLSGNLVTGDSLWLADGLDKATEDGALAFMLFLNNPDNAVAWHKSNHYLPMTRTAVRRLEAEGWFTANPADRIAIDQVNANTGTPAALGPVLGDFHGVQTALTSAVHDVLVGGADPATRLRQADHEAQRHLSTYNAWCASGGQRHANCFRIYPLG